MLAMFKRHQPVLTLAGILFVIYLAVQASWWLTKKPHHVPLAAAYVAMIGIGLVMLGFVYAWSQRWPSSVMMPRALVALALGAVLSAVLGPFARWEHPFQHGAGDFFNVIWLFLAVGLLGGIIGMLFAMALGKDYRTEALRRYEASKLSKPRRV